MSRYIEMTIVVAHARYSQSFKQRSKLRITRDLTQVVVFAGCCSKFSQSHDIRRHAPAERCQITLQHRPPKTTFSGSRPCNPTRTAIPTRGSRKVTPAGMPGMRRGLSTGSPPSTCPREPDRQPANRFVVGGAPAIGAEPANVKGPATGLGVHLPRGSAPEPAAPCAASPPPA